MLSLPSITNFGVSKILAHADDLRKFIARHSNIIRIVVFHQLDLTGPAKGAWSGLLSSLTWLKDARLICIYKPLKSDETVSFESEDKDSFERYVKMYFYYEDCWCGCCNKYYDADLDLHWSAEYMLGTDIKKADWRRGLELMMVNSRTIVDPYRYEDDFPDP
jgi:hypothetical protein